MEGKEAKSLWKLIKSIKNEKNEGLGSSSSETASLVDKNYEYFPDFYTGNSFNEKDSTASATIFKSYLEQDLRNEDVSKWLNAPLTEEEVSVCASKQRNCKSGGIDKI